MIVKHSYSNGILTFIFNLERGDHKSFTTPTGRKVDLKKTQCRIYLPSSCHIKNIHPDLLALTICLIIWPWVGQRIVLPFAVSPRFANAFKNSRKMISPVNPKQKPRTTGADYHPSLGYSTGTDSAAAALVMPTDTRLIFLDRILPLQDNSLYKKDAAYYALDMTLAHGYNVQIVRTDMEEMRFPVGFPIDISNTIGNVILADHLKLDCVALGYDLHDLEQMGDKSINFICSGDDNRFNARYSFWNSMFVAAGLHLSLPIIGMTEILAEKIVLNSPLRYFVQSCMRGVVHRPCLNCNKCFRRTLIKYTMEGKSMSNELIDKMFNAIGKLLQAKKTSVYNVHNVHAMGITMAYVTYHYKGYHPTMLKIKQNIAAKKPKYDKIMGWYPSTLKYVPKKYQATVKRNIMRYSK